MEESNQSKDNYNKDEQLSKQKENHIFKKKIKNNNKLKQKYILSKTIICIIMLLIYFKKTSYSSKHIINNIPNKLYNDSDFDKYKIMLPHLTPDLNEIPSTIKDIFNARQIYISDVRITPDYIKYIRPINETEELKYNNRYEKKETIVDKTIFEKKPDQYNYIDFCKIALDEKLIDYNTKDTKEYDNRPIISLVLPSYNKQDMLLKSVRSIQNQNFKNIEIIIVNDCSTDNSSKIFNYLLETDPRIKIFHHMTNMGLFRSRLDGILYSRGKYIISFEPGDLYEDNYVLSDALNVIEKYNLDSCKFLFRVLKSFNYLKNSIVYYHVNSNEKIAYGPDNIKTLNHKIFSYTGNIWNRLVRANIYTKALLLFNELTLNVYKNMWDDYYYNEIIHKVSYSYAIFNRIGYVYLQNGKGYGSPSTMTLEPRNYYLAREHVGFLYYDYNFCEDKECKNNIIQKLKDYNERNNRIQLKYFINHFEVLNNLLKGLIKDSDISEDNKKYCEKLLDESLIREKNINKTI